uniref:Uncharacterized protein n=1 Tax=Xenopus tropicalis TaxID=8364 RepID=A0A1B8Y9X3_XENTR
MVTGTRVVLSGLCPVPHEPWGRWPTRSWFYRFLPLPPSYYVAISDCGVSGRGGCMGTQDECVLTVYRCEHHRPLCQPCPMYIPAKLIVIPSGYVAIFTARYTVWNGTYIVKSY